MSALRKALEPGHKRKFLVVVDETPECRKATQFAARRADRTNGGLVLLYVIPPAVFQQWKGVEDLMRAEAMEKAETLLGGVADLVRQWSTVEPQQVIREGDTATEVTALIERDEDIAVLVLGAGSGKEGRAPRRHDRGTRRRHVPRADHHRARKPRRGDDRRHRLTLWSVIR